MFLDAIERNWGDGTLIALYAPSKLGNRVFVEWWARLQRSAVSPGMARKLMEMITRTDLRAVLPTIRVPTLGDPHAPTIGSCRSSAGARWLR